MVTPKRKLGDFGEEIAVKFLRKKGYKILERNFQRKWGEIDVVAKKKKDLIFVEVKTILVTSNQQQATRDFISPEESITFFKKKKLIRTAKLYLLEKNLPVDIPWQIDVIAIELDYDTEIAHLKHYQNAIFES